MALIPEVRDEGTFFSVFASMLKIIFHNKNELKKGGGQ